MNDEPPWEFLPFEPQRFFGVTWDFDPHDLRRRYAALVRRYKPDKFPEEFQKIRAAYESLTPRSGGASEPNGIVLPTPRQPAPDNGQPEFANESPAPLTEHGQHSPDEKSSKPANWRTIVSDEPALRRWFESLVGKKSKRPNDYLSLAAMSDVLDDAHPNRFDDWLLAGLSAYPSDQGLLSLWRDHLARGTSVAELPELLRRTADILANDRFIQATALAWRRLLLAVPFPQFARDWGECLSNWAVLAVSGRAPLIATLLRPAAWRADEGWLDDATREFDKGALDYSQSNDLDLVDLARRYRADRKRFLDGAEVRARLDAAIEGYLSLEPPASDRAVFDCLAWIDGHPDAVIAGFPAPGVSIESAARLWHVICADMLFRKGVYWMTSSEEEARRMRRDLTLSLWQSSRRRLCGFNPWMSTKGIQAVWTGSRPLRVWLAFSTVVVVVMFVTLDLVGKRFVTASVAAVAACIVLFGLGVGLLSTFVSLYSTMFARLLQRPVIEFVVRRWWDWSLISHVAHDLRDATLLEAPRDRPPYDLHKAKIDPACLHAAMKLLTEDPAVQICAEATRLRSLCDEDEAASIARRLEFRFREYAASRDDFLRGGELCQRLDALAAARWTKDVEEFDHDYLEFLDWAAGHWSELIAGLPLGHECSRAFLNYWHRLLDDVSTRRQPVYRPPPDQPLEDRLRTWIRARNAQGAKMRPDESTRAHAAVSVAWLAWACFLAPSLLFFLLAALYPPAPDFAPLTTTIIAVGGAAAMAGLTTLFRKGVRAANRLWRVHYAAQWRGELRDFVSDNHDPYLEIVRALAHCEPSQVCVFFVRSKHLEIVRTLAVANSDPGDAWRQSARVAEVMFYDVALAVHAAARRFFPISD